MTRRTAQYDVLMVTDCRFPGGSSSSVVEEIQAQHRAGYRTGLLHLPSTVLGRARPFNPKIRKVLDRGQAELVVGVDHVDTRLLLARHPTVFTDIQASMPSVSSDERVLAVNQVPVDDRGEKPYYDVPGVERNLERLFGGEVRWAPIGPRVRDSMVAYEDDVRLMPWDWENVIDVEQWVVERSGFVGDRPVIGRHSRGHWTKWPDNREDIVAAYPTDPAYLVSILGGCNTPRRLLGGLPANWIDHPFNSIPADEYLAQIDFLVYFHHHGLIEAFGRVVLEGMSAGAVCIVPPYLERLFGDVCLYGEPNDVRGYVDELYADHGAFLERSKRGLALARERFSYDTHVRRVSELIGAPSPQDTPAHRADRALSQQTPAPVSRVPRPRALVLDLAGSGQVDSPAADVVTGMAGEYATIAAVPAQRVDAVREQADLVETFPRMLTKVPADAGHAYQVTRATEISDQHQPALVICITDGSVQDRDLRPLAREGIDILVIEPGGSSHSATPISRSLADLLPASWSVRPLGVRQATSTASPPADASPIHTATFGAKWIFWRTKRNLRKARRWLGPRLRRSRRHLRPAVAWARKRQTKVLDRAAERAGLSLLAIDRPSITLPTSDLVTHPNPELLPTALVITDERADARSTLRQLAERQQISSAFRLALLVPLEWEPEAARYGFTTETLLTRGDWAEVHAAATWPDHLRARIAAARRTYGCTTVTVAGATEDGTIGLVIEALEATGAPPPPK